MTSPPHMHRQSLDELVARLPDAAVTVGQDLRITRFNAAAERVYGLTAVDVIGQPVTAIAPESDHARLTRFASAVLRGESVAPQQATRRRPNGTELTVSISGMPIFVEEVAEIEVLGIVRDVTFADPQAMVRAFGALVSLTPDSILTVDTKRRITSFNAAAERLYNLRAEDVIGQPWTVLATNRPSRVGLLSRALDGLVVGPERATRHLHDGRTIEIVRTGAPLYGPDGTIIGACAILRDVTAEMRYRREREHSEQQLRRAFDEALIAMTVADLEGRNVEVNDACCVLMRRSRSELLNSTWKEFTHPDDRTDAAAVTRLLLDPDRPDTHIQERRYLLPDGRVVWVEVYVALVRDSDGLPSHRTMQLQDITHRRNEEARLRHMAETDQLTALLNRHGFMNLLEAHVLSTERRRSRGAVLAVDLDNFKLVNDSLGHRAGDMLLASVGRCLSEQLRGSDVAGRLGGDEFVVLLPDASREEAEDVAAKLLTQVARSTAVVAETLDRPVTPSIGIAVFEEIPGTSADEILHLADRAMYSAKRSGKNQYAVYEPDPLEDSSPR